MRYIGKRTWECACGNTRFTLTATARLVVFAYVCMECQKMQRELGEWETRPHTNSTMVYARDAHITLKEGQLKVAPSRETESGNNNHAYHCPCCNEDILHSRKDTIKKSTTLRFKIVMPDELVMVVIWYSRIEDGLLWAKKCFPNASSYWMKNPPLETVMDHLNGTTAGLQ